MRSPVYDPGPLLTAMASSLFSFLPDLIQISSMKTCSFSEWEKCPSLKSMDSITCPFSDKAIEQFFVDAEVDQ